jgi:hypothetical protein
VPVADHHTPTNTRGPELTDRYLRTPLRPESGFGYSREYNNAVWPFPPGQSGFGSYHTSLSIVEGAGRFHYATGSVESTGFFIVGWDNRNNLPVIGANLEYNGHVCNVLP